MTSEYIFVAIIIALLLLIAFFWASSVKNLRRKAAAEVATAQQDVIRVYAALGRLFEDKQPNTANEAISIIQAYDEILRNQFKLLYSIDEVIRGSYDGRDRQRQFDSLINWTGPLVDLVINGSSREKSLARSRNMAVLETQIAEVFQENASGLAANYPSQALNQARAIVMGRSSG